MLTRGDVGDIGGFRGISTIGANLPSPCNTGGVSTKLERLTGLALGLGKLGVYL